MFTQVDSGTGQNTRQPSETSPSTFLSHSDKLIMFFPLFGLVFATSIGLEELKSKGVWQKY